MNVRADVLRALDIARAATAIAFAVSAGEACTRALHEALKVTEAMFVASTFANAKGEYMSDGANGQLRVRQCNRCLSLLAFEVPR